MKKIYLIIAFVVAGVGGIYAMLNGKLWHQNNVPSKVKGAAAISPTSAKSSQKVPATTCCAVEDSMILGTWISVDDPLSKWVFTADGILRMYYADTLSDVDIQKYRITDDTSLCGYDLSAGDAQNRYMEWINVKDSDDTMCFVIYSLTDEVLNVTLFGSGEFNIFKRPWSDYEP